MASCGPPREMKQPDLPDDLIGDVDENVDVAKAKEHIENAVAALRDDKLDVARKELDEAAPFADELKREEIRRVRQSVDEAEANKSIPGIKKIASSGKCEEAVAKSVKIIKGRKGTAVPVFVRKGTSPKILNCLLDQLAVDLSIGRELAESDDVERSLTKADFQTYVTKVTDETVKELVGKFEEPIANKDWAKAKKLLDELVERKEAGDNEYNRIMGLIREGIAKEIAEKVEEGLDDKNKASKRLDEVDTLIEVAEWGEKKGSAAEGAAMPSEVAEQRKQLALWAVCAKLRCTFVSPKKSWTYGDVELKPVLDPTKGKKLKTLEHGTKVWRLAESSSWVLVAKKNPGSIDGVAGRVKKAIGWVKASGNKTSDTREMLPPGDSIIATRVWGPLRKGEKLWELGKVLKVKGSDLAVERIADRVIITIARRKVRFGTIKKGTKVMSRCDHPLNLEPAVIDKVTFPKRGDPIATVTCLGDDGKPSSLTRKEVLGALRSKSSWLPARR
jgi:hypothetical protein